MLEGPRTNHELLQGIAQQSREQASSIDEMTGAVRSLDEMTQHNAALVEETNAAIKQTEAQANELDQVVAVFTVAGTAVRSPSEGRPQRRPAPRAIGNLAAARTGTNSDRLVEAIIQAAGAQSPAALCLAITSSGGGLPPEKWSSLKYGF